MNKPTETTPMNNEQQARRTLLKMATYVPPAILGVMIGGNKIAEAGGAALGQPKVCGGGGTIIISANGNACCPCVPTDPKFDPVKCAWKKCKLGNCPACRQFPPKDAKQCAKVAAACGCACSKGNKNGVWTCK